MIRKRSKNGAKPATSTERSLLSDVRQMILSARESIARTVDSGLTLLYWSVGARIRKDILKERRAEYGEEIVSAVRR